jgi:RimJ/RimL family protein N-acetyltransferase
MPPSATRMLYWSATGCGCAVPGRTTCRHSPAAARAIAAYRKAGFTEEGRAREAVFHDGHWYDEVSMAILAREWRS